MFDIDGTLTDSVPMYLISVTKAMRSLGIKDIDTDYNNYKHHTDSYALRYNFERNFDKQFSDDLIEDFESTLVEQMLLFDPVKEINGAKSLIQLFKEKSIPFCFATGALPKPAILKLKQCDIWYDESLLATSKTHEPREGFVLEAIERAKAFYNRSEFTNIVSVGDGLWDLKTAQSLSLDFVGIGGKNRKKLLDNGAMRCYEDLEEFRKTLF
ncbi:HAD family hydrolase [Aquimarina rubra]|uniref:phosphoglycolate phosphatase n=1 Tax=Aquimarina rubra TaxID=1920033 RepID=A0ABW5LGU0_9FLAO